MRMLIRFTVVMSSAFVAMALSLAFVVSMIPTRFDRPKIQARWGQEFADFLYGACDPDFQSFLARRKAEPLEGLEASERFELAGITKDARILKDEDNQILDIIDRAFGWRPGPEVRFQVSIRENGYVTFHPIPPNMDGIKLDECGYLLGDDYSTRLRHADFMRKQLQNTPADASRAKSP